MIHKLVKARHELAKTFTKDFQDQVKQNLKDYKAEDSWLNSFADDNKLYVNVTKRYEIIIPMIFTNHEGMLASMFDRVPDIVVSQGGKEDQEKVRKIEASYEYLKEKADLESFMNTAAWWFILTGFVSSHVSYEKQGKEVVVTDPDTGMDMIGEDGEPVTVMTYVKDDPVVTVDDPMYTYFSPESEYSVKADKVPYYTRTKLMTVDDVFRTYGKLVEPDSSISEYEKKTNKKANKTQEADSERVKVILYYGTLNSDCEEELLEYGYEFDPDGHYYIVATRSELLHVERTPEDMSTCRILKWYGVPTEFFGFGVAKLLRPFQKEKSLRRTQQARYADVAAFPKLAVDLNTEIDEMAASDPRELPVLTYDGNAPSYLSPPDLSNVLLLSEQKADEDAQRASGMLDLSSGSQSSNTVDTATGQAIFAEAAEKRIRYAKKKFMQFYKEVVILMLKMAQMYWDEEKLVSITDDYGQEEQIAVTADDLKDVNFDKDIKISPDSLTINRDVLRAQAIELYDRVKDDPLIDRKVVFKDMMRIGFDKKNPDAYIKNMDVEPGTTLVNSQTGEMYTVDETGELVTQEAEQTLAQPSQQGSVASSPSGIMGAIQQV